MPSRVCAACRVKASMEPISDPVVLEADHRGRKLITVAYSCHECRFVNIAMASGFDDHASAALDWMHDQGDSISWYPRIQRRGDYTHTPDVIAAAADEAHQCLGFEAVRGALILARAVVEATAKDHGIASGNLKQKIEALAEKAGLREITAAAITEVRHIGNDMAHGDFEWTPTQEEAEEFVHLMDALLDEVYEVPGRVKKIRKDREARKSD